VHLSVQLDLDLQVHFKFTQSWPPSISPLPMIRASICISKSSLSMSPGGLPNAFVFHLQPDWLYVRTVWNLGRWYMKHNNAVNLVILTMMNITDEMHCGYGTSRTTTERIWDQLAPRAAPRSELLSKAPTDHCRGLNLSQILLSQKSNIRASSIHLHQNRFSQNHLWVPLQCLRALCLAPDGPGSNLKYTEALVRVTRLSGMYPTGSCIN